MLMTLWLSLIAIAIWLAVWWLANLLSIAAIPSALAAIVIAGIVVKIMQDRMLPSARSCPTCKTGGLRRLRAPR